ncbi:penicillin-binding transpeptidase domain-containing protein [Microbacterium horticulturae]|uniref:Penicillin-binding transpeptidase domain-containing protein n=1 Tax=Microbacterium horticulturae TaxID=3028316 RepID=A0ABY8C045_9MICO|nr:penicillin-binding transpeptidase domain-containing protein [Microbacterium sp. KACC 23027]WEG08707.1 penicillin-binding transpeptidase domain-containing protein [Microbacterium sp. KACC 23027]
MPISSPSRWTLRLAAAATLCVLASSLSACTATNEPDTAALRKALVSGDFSHVRLSGASASQAQEEYSGIVKGLGDMKPTVKIDAPDIEDDRGTAVAHWSWPAGAQKWTYTTTVKTTKKDGEWYVDWSPAIVQPDLHTGDVLRRTTQAPPRADILGSDGDALITSRPVVTYGIDKSHITLDQALASARELAPLVGVDADDFVGRVKSGGEKQFVQAITYREADVPSGAAHATDITGVLAMPGSMQLGPYRGFASPLLGAVGPVTAEIMEKNPGKYEATDTVGLSGLEQRYDERLRGTVGVQISRVPQAGDPTTLFTAEPKPGEPLQTTLDEHLQTIAESALKDIGPASALVAIRPSDGAILAAANGPGTGAFNAAMNGQVPPGSTFKMFDTLALLRAGLTPDSKVDCTDEAVVDGYKFVNDSWYPSSATGKIPLKTAIAQSCNTAMINARNKIGDVTDAAQSLGFGIADVPGVDSFPGQIPEAGSVTEAAADVIGQGKVLASPVAMAAGIASIQAGHTVVPTLFPSQQGKVPDSVTPLSTEEARQLKTIFRQPVVDGTAVVLKDVPGTPVIAKTGTAEFTQDGKSEVHAWMVAAQDDLAVAVFVDTGSSGADTAGPIAKEFLTAAR